MPKITIIKIIHFTIDFLLAGFNLYNDFTRFMQYFLSNCCPTMFKNCYLCYNNYIHANAHNISRMETSIYDRKSEWNT